jgi:hypothetical protein
MGAMETFKVSCVTMVYGRHGDILISGIDHGIWVPREILYIKVRRDKIFTVNPERILDHQVERPTYREKFWSE